jgi:tripartite-type tricarboxylate transporter receptor subunit TctC
VGWVGFFVPAGTPRPVVARLNGDIVRILGMPDTQERLAGHGMIPGGGTPEDLGAFLKAEIAKWAKLIKEAGIRIQ